MVQEAALRDFRVEKDAVRAEEVRISGDQRIGVGPEAAAWEVAAYALGAEPPRSRME